MAPSCTSTPQAKTQITRWRSRPSIGPVLAQVPARFWHRPAAGADQGGRGRGWRGVGGCRPEHSSGFVHGHVAGSVELVLDRPMAARQLDKRAGPASVAERAADNTGDLAANLARAADARDLGGAGPVEDAGPPRR